MLQNYITNDTYRDKCDPRCVEGCTMCKFTCYRGNVVITYTVNNESYNIYNIVADCWANRSSVEETLNVNHAVGSKRLVWYNLSDPTDS